MLAVRVDKVGPPGVLRPTDVEIPKPAEGKVLVKLHAIGVNFLDVKQRSGAYPREVPFVPGIEGAGEVVEDPSGSLAEGQLVVSPNVLGAYAEYALIDAARAVPVPQNLDPILAAAAIVQGLTAQYLTNSAYPVAAGDTCLVLAASSGVGLALTQLAKALGARVIGVVSTEAKAEVVRSVGAEETIIDAGSGFVEEVRKIASDGVQVAYDGVGSTRTVQALDTLTRRGSLVCFGEAGGPADPIPPRLLGAGGSLRLTRTNLIDYTSTREELVERSQDVFRSLDEGSLTVRIAKRLALSDAREAHELVESRKLIGKIVLLPT